MALKIAKEEGDVNLFVVQLAALLHDIADWKFHGGNDSIGSRLARERLKRLKVELGCRTWAELLAKLVTSKRTVLLTQEKIDEMKADETY